MSGARRRVVWSVLAVALFAVLLSNEGEIPGDTSAPHSWTEMPLIGVVCVAGGLIVLRTQEWHVRVMYSWSRMSGRTKARLVRWWAWGFITVGVVALMGAVAKLLT